MPKLWILRVKLNGEWEECCYASSAEALATFSELAQDYRDGIGQALLWRPKTFATESAPVAKTYIN